MLKEKIMTIKRLGSEGYALIGKLLELLIGFGKMLEALEGIPFLGDTVADFRDAVAMLSDYHSGRYRKLPVKVMLGLAAIAAYIMSPLDIIPDSLPIIGVLDDALVYKALMGLCVDAELERYRRWRAENGESKC